MEPENTPLEKEKTSEPNHHFQVRFVNLRGDELISITRSLWPLKRCEVSCGFSSLCCGVSWVSSFARLVGCRCWEMSWGKFRSAQPLGGGGILRFPIENFCKKTISGMIGKMIIQEKSLSNVWEAEDFLSGMLSFKARWFSGHDLFGFFAPKSWGFNNYDSQFDVYVSTHQQDSSRKSFRFSNTP